MNRTYWKLSRPRFWLYLLGPFLIGVISSDTIGLFWPALAVFAFYFTFPANLLINGLDDVADYNNGQTTDQVEQLVNQSTKWPIIKTILLWNVPFAVVWLADEMPKTSKIALAVFLFLGVFYSLKPIRAKGIPLLDTIFNSMYVFPGVFAYGLLEYKFPPLMLVAAATLWCMAAYAFLAIPDIDDDRQVGLRTVATLLRARGTLIFCALCFGGATFLSYPWLGLFSLGVGAFYMLMTLITLLRRQPGSYFALYQFFPYINLLLGASLFVYVALIANQA